MSPERTVPHLSLARHAAAILALGVSVPSVVAWVLMVLMWSRASNSQFAVWVLGFRYAVDPAVLRAHGLSLVMPLLLLAAGLLLATSRLPAPIRRQVGRP